MTTQDAIPTLDFTAELKLKGFKVYAISHQDNVFRYYNRKDFFKICLITSNNRIHYADQSFETEGSILFFGNPRTPYSWEVTSREFKGYCCLFSEEFLTPGGRTESLQQSPLFKIGSRPIFSLSDGQTAFIDTIFQKMLVEYQTDYAYKDELMRSCIQLIIHEALKLQPSVGDSAHKNAAKRIASVFLDLLERQFPIEAIGRPLQLKTPHDFAQNLAVHVNYLNRSVKEVTGKPTTLLIAERIISEAKALLQHTDWNIADIAFALGFEYPSYFNNYFKRMTGTNPRSLRALPV